MPQREKKRGRNDQGGKMSHRKTSRQSDIQYTEAFKLRSAPLPLKWISGDLFAGWLCLDPPTDRLTVCLFYHSLGKEHGSRAVAGLRWSQRLTPGGHRASGIASLSLFFASSRAWRAGGDAFISTTSSSLDFLGNYREWLHPTSWASRLPPSPSRGSPRQPTTVNCQRSQLSH